jgi:transposase-like protein
MKTGIRRGDPQRQKYWEEVLRQWCEGGQTARAFCHAQNLPESAFYFWRRKLGQRGRHAHKRMPAALSGALAQANRTTPHGPPPAFLPVHVVEPSGAESARGVEILVTQGRTVRVPPGFDRQTLVDVLAVLEARPC